MDAIKVKGLTKRYQNFTLDQVSFAVPAGSIVGFLGENGSGKTTTIKALLGLIQRDEGDLEILGKKVSRDDCTWKEEIGVVLDTGHFPENLTGKQIETVLRHIHKNWDQKRFLELMERFSVPMEKKYSELSKGMRMKLAISAAMAHSPRLLILDEATSGLDPVVRRDLLDLLLEFIQDEERAVFLSSHITGDIEKVADYILLIHKGRVLLFENKDTLLYQWGLVRCGQEQFAKLDKAHVRGVRRGTFDCEALVDNRRELEGVDGLVVDQISLDDLMVFLVKGEEKSV